VEQVAHQVIDVGRAIEKAFEVIPPEDRLKLNYEELMQKPPETLEQVARFIGADVANRERLAAIALQPRNHKTLDDETWTHIQTALAQ